MIALFIDLNDSYEHGIARGVIRFARARDDIALSGYGWMFGGLRELKNWRGDGVIARVESRSDARMFASLGIPIVDVAGAYNDFGFLSVTNDDFATGEIAAAHLASRGYWRYAYCGVTGVDWSSLRYGGYCRGVFSFSRNGANRRALPTGAEQRVGRIARRAPNFDASLSWWEQPERTERLREWILQLKRPVAIFACNDTAGLKVTAVCRSLGIQIPEEIAVLGVDDEDILCELSNPKLSSIPLDCEAIGYKSAEVLMSLLDTTQKKQPIHGVSDPRWTESAARWGRAVVPPLPPVERESTAIFASDDPIVRRAGQYIRTRSSELLSVSDVAAGCSVARRTLEIHFRNATGRSVHAEIIRTRVAAAATALQGTDVSIEAIARRYGFKTPSRFYSAFRRQFGCTPGTYRSQQGNRGGRGLNP